VFASHVVLAMIGKNNEAAEKLKHKMEVLE
jgi:hypothetical protein